MVAGRWLSKCKYELLIFAALAAQFAVNVDWSQPVREKFFTFYVPDYHIGFTSRALLGSLLGLFTPVLTRRMLLIFIIASFALAYALTAVLLGRLVRRVPEQHKIITIYIVVLFVFSAYSVNMFTKYIGMPDIYMYIFTLLALLCAGGRFLRWTVPLWCVLGLATHYGFALTFMPIIAVVIVYEWARENASKAASVRAGISAVMMGAGSVYFIFFAQKTVRMTPEQAENYLTAKAVDFPLWKLYYEAHLFFSEEGQTYSGIFDVLRRINEYGAGSFRVADLAVIMLFLLPLSAVFGAVWVLAMRERESRIGKLPYLCCLCMPLVFLPMFVISTDLDRVIAELIIAQFAVLFYLLWRHDEETYAALDRAKALFARRPLWLAVVVIVSLSLSFIK